MTENEIRNAVDAYRKLHGHTDIRAALIDMDGTLYDSMPRHARAWHRLATELGIEATEDEFFQYEGMTGAATLDVLFMRARGRHITPDEAREYYARKTRYFTEQPGTAPIMPGAPAMLASLQHSGIQPVLVTGSGQATLLERLEHDFPGVFRADMMVTSHNVTHGKPHPEPYLRGMAMAGVEPSQAIAVENAPLGVQSAARAGAFTVAVSTGPIPKHMLADAGADIVFDSMPRCAEHMPELLRQLRQDKN